MIMEKNTLSTGSDKSKELSDFLYGATNFREDDASRVGNFGRNQASKYG